MTVHNFGFGQDKDGIVRAVNRLSYNSGRTATGDALRASYDIFREDSRDDVPRYTILFTGNSLVILI